MHERQKLEAERRQATSTKKCSPADERVLEERRQALAQRGVSSVADIVGLALPMIGAYGELDNLQQKVAIIDPVSKRLKIYFQVHIFYFPIYIFIPMKEFLLFRFLLFLPCSYFTL